MLNRKREHDNDDNKNDKKKNNNIEGIAKNRRERRKEEHNNKQGKLNQLEQGHSYIFSTGMNKQSENSIQQMIQKIQKQKAENIQGSVSTASLKIKCNDSELGRSLYKYIMNINQDTKKKGFDSTKAYRYTYNSDGKKSTQQNPEIFYKPLEKIKLEITDKQTYEQMENYFKNKRHKEEQKDESKIIDKNIKIITNKIFDSEDSDEESNSNHSILHFSPLDKTHKKNEEEEDIMKYKDITLTDLLKKNPYKHL